MNIIACLNVGDETIIKSWEMHDNHIIIHKFEKQCLAIKLEKSRIRMITSLEELMQRVSKVPPQKEYLEAVASSLDLAYLGNLNMSDAVLINSN
jgi:hypothetical protein